MLNNSECSLDASRRIANTPNSAGQRAYSTDRLMELFKRRGDIEAKIIEHTRILEQAYSSANSEFREILKGKLEDIGEGPKGVQAEGETTS
jgi:hypothetical protein